ncbi:MAG: hypothetical protein ABSA57_06365 [Candidatus Acidiferrales bacterium]|jgi:hypothetical protein
MPHQIKTLLYREGWPLTVSCGLVYLGFAIQLLGMCLAVGLLPLLKPAPSFFWRYVAEFDFNLTTISPLLSLFALHILRTPVAYESAVGKRRFAWRVVGTALLVSFFEFWWSWNGHPGWLRGFVG